MSKNKIFIKPSEQTIEVDADDKRSLLEMLKDAGLPIKSSCGGVASCRECLVKIEHGDSYLSPPPYAEIKLLGNVFHITKERLSCQVKALGGNIGVDVSAHLNSPGRTSVKKMPPRTRLRKKSDLKKPTETPRVSDRNRQEAPRNKNLRPGGRKRPRFFNYSDDSEKN